MHLSEFMRMVGATSIWDPIECQVTASQAVCSELFDRRQQELAWLRASLERELFPDWLIDMVVERWPNVARADIDPPY